MRKAKFSGPKFTDHYNKSIRLFVINHNTVKPCYNTIICLKKFNHYKYICTGVGLRKFTPVKLCTTPKFLIYHVL